MWDLSILGTDLYHIIHWFFIYSILGWFVESIYMSICNKKLTNRGFIFGPICPIYGFGALSVYFILRPLDGNYVLLYFAGALLATSLELVTAKLMIAVFGEVWWDYNDKPYNYKGILCLESTLAWGFYTIFLFLFLQRFTEFIVSSYSYEHGKIIGSIVIIYFIIDFTVHLYRAKMDSFPKRVLRLRDSIRSFYRDYH